ncbi:condensation domain-containing protein, partial [Bacillus wiedmannii]
YINWLSSQNQEEAGTYWRKYLEDYDNKPMLPGAFKSKKKFEGKAYTVELTTSQFQELNKVAIKYQVTLNSLIQTIFGILLSKYNDVNDIVFG